MTSPIEAASQSLPTADASVRKRGSAVRTGLRAGTSDIQKKASDAAQQITQNMK